MICAQSITEYIDDPNSYLGGFRKIGDISSFGCGWEWYVIGVFQDMWDGTFRYAEDSGCSCNHPWQDLRESDLGARLTWREACVKVMQSEAPGEGAITDYRAECRDLVAAIKQAVTDYKAWSNG